RTATGGAACGPTGSSGRPWPARPSTAGSRPRGTCDACRRAGGPGRPHRTAGSPFSTARYSAAADRRTSEKNRCPSRPTRIYRESMTSTEGLDPKEIVRRGYDLISYDYREDDPDGEGVYGSWI